jgi:hypothetical protein
MDRRLEENLPNNRCASLSRPERHPPISFVHVSINNVKQQRSNRTCPQGPVGNLSSADLDRAEAPSVSSEAGFYPRPCPASTVFFVPAHLRFPVPSGSGGQVKNPPNSTRWTKLKDPRGDPANRTARSGPAVGRAGFIDPTQTGQPRNSIHPKLFSHRRKRRTKNTGSKPSNRTGGTEWINDQSRLTHFADQEVQRRRRASD